MITLELTPKIQATSDLIKKVEVYYIHNGQVIVLKRSRDERNAALRLTAVISNNVPKNKNRVFDVLDVHPWNHLLFTTESTNC